MFACFASRATALSRRKFYFSDRAHLTLVSAAAAVAMFAACPLAESQEATAPPDPASAVDGKPATLPPVTVETTEDVAKPAPAPYKPAKPVVKVESDDPVPPKPAKKKTVKAEKPKQAQPPAENYEPASEPVDTVAADALSGVTPAAAARGGPTQIDGYIAKQTTTATKTATPLKNVPQSVSVTTAQQASDQGSRSVGQALTYVPGVTVSQGEGHRDQLTIRGQATTADFYVDGVRDDAEYYRDLYNVESIEVVKGPNAMVFGRGGSGGVVNRSTKQADGQTIRAGTITYGMYDTKRATVDVGQALSSSVAFRMNAMYEDAGSFRDHFELERFAINPTMGFTLSDSTKLLVSYEFYKDDRTVDRGVPSLNGRPLEGFRNTFFGNPDASVANFEGHRLSAILDHRFSDQFKVRSATVYADTDKVYANTFAANSVRPNGDVPIDGYRDTQVRETFINQTDWTYRFDIAPGMRNTTVFGTELSHQGNQNFRDLPTFTAGQNLVSLANPTYFSPVAFDRPNRRRDATLDSAGVYVQNQLEVSRYVELLGGIRFDHYDVDFSDQRNAANNYNRQDDIVSPRGGIVFKPSEQLSVYLSYSEASIPSIADQLNSPGITNAKGSELDPEKFVNREIGFKWEVTPRLLLTGALFELERSNTPVLADASGQVTLFGATETRGGELGLTGYITDEWQVAAGFGHQIALITEGTAATIGNDVASVPRNTVSLWNKYQFTPMFGAGLGVVHKTSFFPAGDNRVEVPGYTRFDAALFLNLSDTWTAQVNVENIFNEDYFTSAHTNNNISPGAPTSVYVTLGAKF
ncbi:MAG: TonB-dependent siderophore receptor [Hyphomicrobium sp.]